MLIVGVLMFKMVEITSRFHRVGHFNRVERRREGMKKAGARASLLFCCYLFVARGHSFCYEYLKIMPGRTCELVFKWLSEQIFSTVTPRCRAMEESVSPALTLW